MLNTVLKLGQMKSSQLNFRDYIATECRPKCSWGKDDEQVLVVSKHVYTGAAEQDLVPFAKGLENRESFLLKCRPIE